MSDPQAAPPGEDQLLREAAGWFARMRGPDAEASRADFEAWLARGALHRRAYNRAAEIFAMGKLLSEPDQVTELPNKAQHPRRRLALSAVGALLVIALASMLILRSGVTDPQMTSQMADGRSSSGTDARQIASASGESRSVRLADGSLVTLKGASIIDVRFDARGRRLLLESGEARFEVAHESRPFVVEAGGGTVTAHGTIFDVALSGARLVTVRLIEGVVDVAPPEKRPGPPPYSKPTRLHAGETMRFAATSPRNPQNATTATSPAPSAAQSPGAARDYDGITLADLVAAANRGASRPIRLADPAIGNRRISGRFSIGDTQLLAERIAALFDLRADSTNPAEIVLKPK